MSFDIASARVRIGLMANDTSKDALLNAALQTALTLAENYCDRQFTRKTEKIEFYQFISDQAQLSRFPVVRVDSIERDGVIVPPNLYNVHHMAGRILFHCYQAANSLTIQYEGGFIQPPADLEIALWSLFDAAWTDINATAGGASNSNGIKSISVPDVGRIEYAVASSGSGDGTNELMSSSTKMILDLYKIRVC